MSGAARKAIRAAVSSALAGRPGWSEISAWVQTVDASRLPAWAVATPSERSDRDSNDGFARNDLTLIVMAKRTGPEADILADMDDDADALAPLVIAAVGTGSIDCILTETATRVDRTGERPVGTLTLQFAVTYWIDPA